MTDDAPEPAVAPETTPEATPASTLKSRWLTGRSMLALGVSVVALGFAAAPYVVPGLFGAQVRSYLMTHPEVLYEAQTAWQVKQQNDQIAQVNAAAAAHPAALSAAPGEPVFGPAHAKVTVVQFFDYQCPYCKAMAPDFLRLIQANPDVRFIFKEWPILDHDGQITSRYAAQAALLAHAQGKYLAVHQALMAERALTPQAVDKVLAANGVTGPVASPDAARIVTNVRIDATGLGIQGTPTLFINGRMSPTHDPAQLAQIINAEKAK
ncbi:MAG: disulfide bond formation protein DsbA [Caulobacteraceae bacterium]|nr:disulfide bond formation protein DsbA [Caulobacteraceae bacterium]